MSRTCLIISGGEYDDIRPQKCDLTIACDKGYEYALRLGIKPDLVIGDFDSYSGEIDGGIDCITLPASKDDTDTGYAVKYAIQHGSDDITIICALGGRLDHTISNLQTLCRAARANVSARILSTDTVIHAVCNSGIVLEKRSGWAFSVFSAADVCKGVTIKGAKYPLNDAELYNTYPIGQSNDWAEDRASICCREGILIIIESRI